MTLTASGRRSPLDVDRCFSADPTQRHLARELYEAVRDLPIVSPHGHVPVSLLADPGAGLGTPADVFVVPDHYVFRMLHSQGVPLERLGVPTLDGTPTETDPRRIWDLFCQWFWLFRGTPSALWISAVLGEILDVDVRLDAESSSASYDAIAARLTDPEMQPRALLRSLGIEVLCTTDGASDDVSVHEALRTQGVAPVRPTFRPDALLALASPAWPAAVQALEQRTGVDVVDTESLLQALRERRDVFRAAGATATDSACEVPHVAPLPRRETDALLDRARNGCATAADSAAFTAAMLFEMALMSADDGLVMQLHAGSARDHDPLVAARFGPDRGADIPVRTEWTRNLRPLLEVLGSSSTFRLILFTLDESTYSRELAPLAGHYPAVLLGPPWWFHDSVNGITRYLDAVVETAGIANLAGFNDDTRAFLSIPVRHDVWRRVTCDWIAGRQARGLIDEHDAREMAIDLAVRRARSAYRLERTTEETG